MGWTSASPLTFTRNPSIYYQLQYSTLPLLDQKIKVLLLAWCYMPTERLFVILPLGLIPLIGVQ